MKRRSLTVLLAAGLVMCAALLEGCEKEAKMEKGKESREPLTMSTAGIDYRAFEKLVAEKYPEVKIKFESYTGSNATGYLQYRLEHGDIPDIYGQSVFGLPGKQEEILLDLSGYEFLNNFKTVDVNQVTLDGAVYMVPTSPAIIGLYYNQTLFREKGWEVPGNLEELKALTKTVREAGIDPVAAQFELSGNGFFDLFTIAKTDFLSTTEGLQWERDFKEGRAAAAEGLGEAAALLQELIDCGFFDKEDTLRNAQDTVEAFLNREAAMYLNAGLISRFTQNEDGTGDQYGIMPFLGVEEDNNVLITKPTMYLGLSKSLSEAGSEQKLEDALKIMELLSTEEGQLALVEGRTGYTTPLKNYVIPDDSPFYEVKDTIQSGYTSTLAYAGYEPIIIEVGDKVRDWVAGECTGDDVLELADRLQAESLEGKLAPAAVAGEELTIEETAQLNAQAFRQAAKTDIGLVSLGGYHDGIENPSGACGKLYAGDIDQGIVNAVVPGKFNDQVCVLTLKGKEIKELLETGFIVEGDEEGFPYIPAGITVTKKKDGTIEKIVMEDGTNMEEDAVYTAAVDDGGYTKETGQKGSVQKTELIVVDVVGEYLNVHSPLAAPEPSVQ